MLKILIAIALEINSIHRVNVDLIELNHQHSTDGLIKFDQVIIWKWSPDYRRYDAQHWFIPHRPTEFPTKTGSLYQCSAPNPTTTIFQSKLYRETWTNHDPERENLNLFPSKLRSIRLGCSDRMDP